MHRGIWNTLELLAGGHQPSAVLAEWQRLADGEFAALRGFLRVTPRLAGDYPCLGERDCGCRHELDQIDAARWVAKCQCEIGDCPPLRLSPGDLIIHELDAARFGGEVARTLGFGAAESTAVLYAAPKIWQVGTYAATRSAVYLGVFASEAELFANIEGLVSARPEPFILLSPTASLRSATVDSFLARVHCGFVSLSACLAADEKGRFHLTGAIEPVLGRFAAGLARGQGLAKTVERIDRNIEAVAKGQYDLRKENEELRQLNKDGYFNFAVRVNGDDFLAFAVIMALGNRKAAADHLKIPHRTFYNRVEQWAARGREYQLMRRYMKWRKRSSRHLKVGLNPSLQSGDAGNQAENPDTLADVLTEIKAADNKDYPSLLADVLQALERQNAGNWMKVRQELVEMIKEDVLQ